MLVNRILLDSRSFMKSKLLVMRFVNRWLSQIMELLEHKSIFTAGYKCILHVHAAVEECECIQLDARLDMKTKQKVTVRIT